MKNNLAQELKKDKIRTYDLDKLETDEVQRIFTMCREVLDERLNSEPITFDRLISFKKRINSQKFSNYFEKQFKEFMGWQTFGNSPYAELDAVADDGSTKEIKYATYNDARGASFPQIMRLDWMPDEYVIGIFFDSNFRIYRVPGDIMHNSIIKENSTRAHADNENERRINIRNNSPEMNFLAKYRDLDLENKFKNFEFGPPK